MQHRHFISVFLLRPNGKSYDVLLGRRAPDKYMGGTWQLITGAIEPGETAWQAVLRETREETDLRVTELFRLSTLTHFYHPDLDALFFGMMFCGFVELGAVERLNAEHTALQWVSFDEARRRLIWAADFTALDEVQNQIVHDGPRKPHLRIALPDDS